MIEMHHEALENGLQNGDVIFDTIVEIYQFQISILSHTKTICQVAELRRPYTKETFPCIRGVN